MQIRKSGLPARTKREDGTTLVATALERICSQRAAHQANESFKPTPLRGVVLGSRYQTKHAAAKRCGLTQALGLQ